MDVKSMRNPGRAGKRDMVIYDEPGWNSFTYNFPVWGGIRRNDDGSVVIRFDSADASCINDDFYFEHHRQIVMQSGDGGSTWKRIDPDWQYYMPLELSDGTLIEVVENTRMMTRPEQKARLDALGIGHVWRDDCELSWQLWPESMAEEMRRRGVRVWDRAVPPYGDSLGQRWLPEGVVAINIPEALIGRISRDGGGTWEQRTVLPFDERYLHFGAGFAGSVVLADDTILVPFYAMTRQERTSEPENAGCNHVHLLRSDDRGRSYALARLDETAGPGVDLNETFFVEHPSGNVVALSRSDFIHCSVSEDRGKSWSTPVSTGIPSNAPHHAICLRSGVILCFYARRKPPGGIRCTLSYDGGRSWDVENELIVRDDSPVSDFIGGPGAIQLDDDRIFVFYNLVRNEPGDPPKRPHCYIAGSVFDEKWLRSGSSWKT